MKHKEVGLDMVMVEWQSGMAECVVTYVLAWSMYLNTIMYNLAQLWG